MPGLVNIIVVLAAIVLIALTVRTAVLREGWNDGLRERAAICMVLVLTGSIFTLIVARSGAGIERYRQDLSIAANPGQTLEAYEAKLKQRAADMTGDPHASKIDIPDLMAKKKIELSSNGIKARRTLALLQWGLAGLALAVLITQVVVRRLAPHAPPFTLPLFLFCIIDGLCLVLSLSLTYLLKLRFLFERMYIDLLTALVVFTLSCILLRSTWLRRFIDSVCINRAKAAICFLLMLTAVTAICLVSKNYVGSEAVRLFLLLCLAWLAVNRGDYIARRVAITGVIGALRDRHWLAGTLTGFMATLAAVVLSLLALHDLGPLLLVFMVVLLYIYLLMGSGSLALAGVLWAIVAPLLYLFREPLGHLPLFSRVFARIGEMLEPFRFGSGELPRLISLLQAAGLDGFKFGEVPYSGNTIVQDGYRLVISAQLQSDYTSTHQLAQWGWVAGGIILICYLLWINQMLVSAAGRLNRLDMSRVDRFFLWFAAAGMLMLELQALLTISGNLALLPLTGITLPFISYGASSLWACTAILAVYYASCGGSRGYPR